MFQNKTDYDRGVNTFSPEGRLFQVEYALQAIKLGASALAIKVNEGVVLAGERKLNSTLLEPKSIEKIYEIDTHLACTASGFIPDARTLVEHARVESQNHKFNYGEPINVRALTQIVCDLALDFGESDSKNKTRMSRPYGVALLIAGVSDQGPQIYQTDPTGTMIEYQAKGIGAADEGIQSILKEQYKQDLTLEQAERLAILCLKNVMEEKINNKNVELAVITIEFIMRSQQKYVISEQNFELGCTTVEKRFMIKLHTSIIHREPLNRFKVQLIKYEIHKYIKINIQKSINVLVFQNLKK